MIDYTLKTFTASMHMNKYSDNTLRLYVYGTAFVEFHKLQDEYTIINVEEKFYNNEKAEVRQLNVTLTLVKNGDIN